MLKSAWFGRGDPGEIFFYLPWYTRGYVIEYDLENGYRQFLVVIGLRPGSFRIQWGQNSSGPIVARRNDEMLQIDR